MVPKQCRRVATGFVYYIVSILTLSILVNTPISSATSPETACLWEHDNLFVWGAITTDAKDRDPEERTRMLNRLGFRQFAFDWQAKHVAIFEEQIKALKRHGIRIIAWTVYDTDDPTTRINWKTHKIQDMEVLAGQREPLAEAPSVGSMLELFRRSDIAPQLWIIRRMRSLTPLPERNKPISEWSDDEKNQTFRQLLAYDLTSTPEQQALRVSQEADHLMPLAQLAASYGLKVGLYKHGGWIGVSDNQIAVIEHLKRQGITNVGVVYNFIHAHDEVDDTSNFSALWNRIQPYVLAVNITGLQSGPTTVFPILYPSQGDLELKMMEIIQHSGWRGPVGLSPEKGGDAEINLRNNIIGLDWIASELKRSGSGGPRPFSLPRS